MRRNFRQLAQERFDLLVVGGGVYGSWIAYDAALRGLRVALVEKADWAAATSSASSKLIHGGLRYVEQFEFGLVRKTLDERKRLLRLAPHCVRPLRFVFPVYSGDRVGRLRLRIGLWLYDRLAGAKEPLGPHTYVSAGRLLHHYDLQPEGLRGGFSLADCQTDDARFTLEIVDGAVGAGAVAINRARATGLLLDGGRVAGASVEDVESGERLDVHAGVTANCTGPWCRELPDVAGAEPAGIRLTKGVHLVLPPLPADEALVVSSNEDSRIVFLIPWYGRTLLGTTDTDYTGDPREVRVERDDVTYLLDRANRLLAGTPWDVSDVIGAYAGLRTLPASHKRNPSAVSREWKLTEPLDGLLSPVGGKFTSARSDAADAVDRVQQLLGQSVTACPTAERPFPWCPRGDYDAWSRETLRRGLHLGLDEETAEYLQLRHGTKIEQIYERIDSSPELAERILPDAPFCLAEFVHAVVDEMAVTLEDVLRRRLPLLLVSRLSNELIARLATLAGTLLGWSEARRLREVETLTAPARD